MVHVHALEENNDGGESSFGKKTAVNAGAVLFA